MNYNVLRYFSVLAQVENYTKAAARLGISQPSLSSAIHNLENDLGCVPLFEKVGRNIRLTAEGRFYQQKVDAALAELHAASTVLRDSRDKAPIVIRLGVVSGALDGLVAQRIADYARENRRVRFIVTEHSALELMDMVRSEQVDMAIVDSTDRDRSLHFRKLTEQDFFVAVPATHPLAERELLEPEDIMAEPLIVYNYSVSKSFDYWANGSAEDENVVCTVNTAQAAMDLVRTGMGIAFVPEGCVHPQEGVRLVPLRKWRQALYMCILYDKWQKPPVWEFCERVVRDVRAHTEEKQCPESE